MANCARVTARDILATNGIVHVVDKVNIINFAFVIIVFAITVVVIFVIVVVVILVVNIVAFVFVINAFVICVTVIITMIIIISSPISTAQMIQPATNSLGQILNNDFGFAKFSKALKASGM